MATVLHLMLSHDRNLRRIQKVQRVQYDGQNVRLSHVHKRIHVHDHVLHEVHKRVHIQHKEQDEGNGLDAHIHVHNHDYDGILDVDNHVCEHDHTNEVGRVALRRHRAEACAHNRNGDHKRNEQIGLGTNLGDCLIFLHLEHTELS